ncbi:MAG: Re/Si-specific NAD(P)(+) transhydrogenase subunit alpha [SAR324 cluster bacterium]|nr:Re/Si-specific NAD(P)(+) transhydrogenase subunit alpha [SAR324 cluster bacterium]
MKIGIPKEVHPEERRVAAVPGTVVKLKKMGFDISIESGAGIAAKFTDEAYKEAGATIVSDVKSIWSDSDIVMKVRAPEKHPKLKKDEVELLKEGGTLISMIWPAQNQELLEKLAARKATVFAMDSIPRISRAQSMDVLSSMANVAGYRAMVEAANHFGRFFTGQITAAGKIPPAQVLVIGAGVAGLSAIGTAQNMGAVVRSFDTRPEVKEQVESMGAKFLMLDFEEDGSGEGGYAKVMSKEFIDAEMALFMEQAKEVDIIVTTALIPGKKAPTLITKEMVKNMKEGSVVIDLAAEQGGNCEATKPGEVTTYEGVTIVGLTDLPSRLPTQSSQLYSTNLLELIKLLGDAEKYNVNMEDEIIRGTIALHEGEITWPPPKPKVVAAPPKPAAAKEADPTVEAPPSKPSMLSDKRLWIAAGILLLGGLGSVASPSFLSHFTVFVIACFVGWLVVWNVTPSLHTPLMSVTNAISGIIVIGGMLHIAGENSWLAAIAILIATINIAGGFLVTQRMLKMFRK